MKLSYIFLLFLVTVTVNGQRRTTQKPNTTETVQHAPSRGRGRSRFTATPEYAQINEPTKAPESSNRRTPSRKRVSENTERRTSSRPIETPQKTFYQVEEVINESPIDSFRRQSKPRVLTETRFEAANAPKSKLFRPSPVVNETPEEIFKNFGNNLNTDVNPPETSPSAAPSSVEITPLALTDTDDEVDTTFKTNIVDVPSEPPTSNEITREFTKSHAPVTTPKPAESRKPQNGARRSNIRTRVNTAAAEEPIAATSRSRTRTKVARKPDEVPAAPTNSRNIQRGSRRRVETSTQFAEASKKGPSVFAALEETPDATRLRTGRRIGDSAPEKITLDLTRTKTRDNGRRKPDIIATSTTQRIAEEPVKRTSSRAQLRSSDPISATSRSSDAPPNLRNRFRSRERGPAVGETSYSTATKSRFRSRDIPPVIDEQKLEVLPLFEEEPKTVRPVTKSRSRSRAKSVNSAVETIQTSATEHDLKFVKPNEIPSRVTVTKSETVSVETRTQTSVKRKPNTKRIKESVVAEVTEVTSKRTVSRRKNNEIKENSVKDKPRVSVSQSVSSSRGKKKSDIKLNDVKKKDSSEEVHESDNYPEPFKALIQAKKGKKESRPSSRPHFTVSTITNIVTTSSAPSTVTSSSDTNKEDDDLENELVPKPFATTKSSIRPTRKRLSPSTKLLEKQIVGTSTKKSVSSPRKTSKVVRSTALPAPFTTAATREHKFHAKFSSTSLPKIETSTTKTSRATHYPRGLYSSRKNKDGTKGSSSREKQGKVGVEAQIYPTQISKSASLKKSNRYSSKYRSDISGRGSASRSTTSAPAYIPTIPTAAYLPTVPTVTPYKTTVNSGAGTKDVDLGLEVISFDDPVNTVPSANLINGELTSSTVRTLNIPASLVKEGTTEKAVSIIERIINSITAINATTAPDSLKQTSIERITESNSAILKLAPKKSTRLDKTKDSTSQTYPIGTVSFTTEKPTTIIEKILSSLSAIQATDDTNSIQVGKDFNTISSPHTTPVSRVIKSSTSRTTLPAQISTSVNPLSVLDEISDEQVLQKRTIGKLLAILNGLVVSTEPPPLVVVTPKASNFVTGGNYNDRTVLPTTTPLFPFNPVTTSLPSTTATPTSAISTTTATPTSAISTTTPVPTTTSTIPTMITATSNSPATTIPTLFTSAAIGSQASINPIQPNPLSLQSRIADVNSTTPATQTVSTITPPPSTQTTITVSGETTTQILQSDSSVTDSTVTSQTKSITSTETTSPTVQSSTLATESSTLGSQSITSSLPNTQSTLTSTETVTPTATGQTDASTIPTTITDNTETVMASTATPQTEASVQTTSMPVATTETSTTDTQSNEVIPSITPSIQQINTNIAALPLSIPDSFPSSLLESTTLSSALPTSTDVGFAGNTDTDTLLTYLSTFPTLQNFEVSPGSVSIFSANDLSNSITPDDNFFTTVTIASRSNFETTAATDAATTLSTTSSVNSATTAGSTTITSETTQNSTSGSTTASATTVTPGNLTITANNTTTVTSGGSTTTPGGSSASGTTVPESTTEGVTQNMQLSTSAINIASRFNDESSTASSSADAAPSSTVSSSNDSSSTVTSSSALSSSTTLGSTTVQSNGGESSNVTVANSTSTTTNVTTDNSNQISANISLSNRSGRLLNIAQDPVSNNIDVSTPSTTTSTTPDYFIFAVLNNNTVLRKRPPTIPNKDTPYVIVGLYPNNTVVRKFPNGTLVPMEQIIRVRGFDTRQNPPPLPEITSNQVTNDPGSSPDSVNVQTAESTSAAAFEPNPLSLDGIISTNSTTEASSSTAASSSTTPQSTSPATSAGSTARISSSIATVSTDRSNVDGTTAASSNVVIGTTAASTTATNVNATVATTVATTTAAVAASSTTPSSTTVATNPTLPTLSELLNGRTLEALNDIINYTDKNNNPNTNYQTLQVNQNATVNPKANTGAANSTTTQAPRRTETTRATTVMLATETTTPAVETTTFFRTVTPAVTTPQVQTTSPVPRPIPLSNRILETAPLPRTTTTDRPTTTSRLPTTTTTAPSTTPSTPRPPPTTTVRRLTTTPVETTLSIRSTTQNPATTAFPTRFSTDPILPFLTTLFPNLLRVTPQPFTTRAPPTTTERSETIFASATTPRVSTISAPPRVRIVEITRPTTTTTRRTTTTTTVPTTTTTTSAPTTTRVTTTTVPTTTRSTTRITTTTSAPTTTTTAPTTTTTAPTTTTTAPTTTTTTTRRTTTAPQTTARVPVLSTRSAPIALSNTILPETTTVATDVTTKKLKQLSDQQKKDLETLVQLEKEQAALLEQLSLLTSLNFGGNRKAPRKESSDLANRVIALAMERGKSTTTTSTTKRPPNSIQDQLAESNGDKPVTKPSPSIEEILKQYNLTGLDIATPSSPTTYGKSDDAILASILKEQGIAPSTPKSLGDQIKQAGIFDETTTQRPKPKTTQRPQGRLMQGLNWLINALAPPQTTTRKPRTKPTKPKKPPVDQELLANSPTHVTPVVTTAPKAFSPNSLSQGDIQKLIKQLETVQKDPKNGEALDLSQIQSLQNLINTNEGVEVLTNSQNGATSRSTTTQPTTKTTKEVQERRLKSTTIPLSSSSSSIVEVEGFGPSTTAKPRPSLPPLKLRPVPGVDDNSDPLIRGNLITAAVNVTRAISGFLGSALQGAAQSFQSFLGSGSRLVGNYAQGSSSRPG